MNAERTRRALQAIHELGFYANARTISARLHLRESTIPSTISELRNGGFLAPKVKGEVGYKLTEQGHNLLFCK